MRLATFGLLVCALVVGVVARLSDESRGGNGGSIYFWTDDPWPSLRKMRPDGSGRRFIFRTPQNAKRPTLSPDGAWVAFDGAAPGKAPLSDFDIQIVRVDGTHRRTVVRSPATELDPQWSPDGSQLSFSRWSRNADWRSSSIWIVRPDGADLRRVSRGQLARWSPDGSLLALDVPTSGFAGDIFVLDLSSGNRQQLLATPQLEQPAAWSPDGKRLLFTRFYTLGGSDVFVMDANGAGARRLTRTPGEDWAAAWSPDGSKIVFTSERTGHPQVFVMNADGSGQRNISHSPASDFATGWH